MKWLYTFLKGLGKASKVILLIKIIVETVEFFNERCKTEFPEVENEPLKVLKNGTELSE